MSRPLCRCVGVRLLGPAVVLGFLPFGSIPCGGSPAAAPSGFRACLELYPAVRRVFGSVCVPTGYPHGLAHSLQARQFQALSSTYIYTSAHIHTTHTHAQRRTRRRLPVWTQTWPPPPRSCRATTRSAHPHPPPATSRTRALTTRDPHERGRQRTSLARIAPAIYSTSASSQMLDDERRRHDHIPRPPPGARIINNQPHTPRDLIPPTAHTAGSHHNDIGIASTTTRSRF